MFNFKSKIKTDKQLKYSVKGSLLTLTYGQSKVNVVGNYRKHILDPNYDIAYVEIKAHWGITVVALSDDETLAGLTDPYLSVYHTLLRGPLPFDMILTDAGNVAVRWRSHQHDLAEINVSDTITVRTFGEHVFILPLLKEDIVYNYPVPAAIQSVRNADRTSKFISFDADACSTLLSFDKEYACRYLRDEYGDCSTLLHVDDEVISLPGLVTGISIAKNSIMFCSYVNRHSRIGLFDRLHNEVKSWLFGDLLMQYPDACIDSFVHNGKIQLNLAGHCLPEAKLLQIVKGTVVLQLYTDIPNVTPVYATLKCSQNPTLKFKGTETTISLL